MEPDVPASLDQGQNGGKDGEFRPRVWPATVIALAYVAFVVRVWLLGSTNHQDQAAVAFAPLLVTFFLGVWWLTFSRVPVRDRLTGLLLFAGTVGWAVMVQESRGYLMFFCVTPVLTTGTVAILHVTYALKWRTQRRAVMVFFLCCAVLFSCLRIDSLSGNLVPILSWRWSPTSEALLHPAQEGHRTANLPAQFSAEDWPGFRGAGRDSHVEGVRIATNWDEAPRELWRRPVGLGWSSFAAVGDYLFTQEQCEEKELVVCYEAATGNVVWVNEVTARYESMMGAGPRATPIFDRGRLFTVGGTGVLQCLDAATGQTLWTRRLTVDLQSETFGWGYSTSPLVVGDKVLVFSAESTGKSMVAYDCLSGEPAWRTGDFKETCSSLQLCRWYSVDQVLMVSDYGLQSFLPETGEVLWEHSWPADKAIRVTQPLVLTLDQKHRSDKPGSNQSVPAVMMGTTDGTRLLRVEKKGTSWGVSEEWFSTRFRPYFNDYVFHKGFIYGFHGDRLACVEAATGKVQWKGKRCGGQILLICDMDVLLVLNEAGEVLLVRTNPEQYTEMARFKALTGKTWNHPAIARGRLFIRNAHEAACLLLPAP